MDVKEARVLIRRARERFDRDVKPLIETGRLELAAGQFDMILETLDPGERKIEVLPSGRDYLGYLGAIQNDLGSGKRPDEETIGWFYAYGAQATMNRPID